MKSAGPKSVTCVLLFDGMSSPGVGLRCSGGKEGQHSVQGALGSAISLSGLIHKKGCTFLILLSELLWFNRGTTPIILESGPMERSMHLQICVYNKKGYLLPSPWLFTNQKNKKATE